MNLKYDTLQLKERMNTFPAHIKSAIDNTDLLIVGSGFFGLTMAQNAAREGFRVTILEKRRHLGGNAWSEVEPKSGIEVHLYGSHLFHTSNREVWDFANEFTTFTNYRHHVFTVHASKMYAMPINLGTIQAFYSKLLSPGEARELIKKEVESSGIQEPKNLEEKAISLVGKSLYDAFIKGYTEKQWQIDPRNLPSEIITRLPVRFDFNTRYFSDTFEGLPTEGYYTWLTRMANHPLIRVFKEVDFFDVKNLVPKNTHIVYTGPLDKFFDYRHGRLSWRTLDFETEVLDIDDFQGASVVNYADLDAPFTRIHEFKHLHPERQHNKGKTVISREFSRSASPSDEPYYPVNTQSDRAMVTKYRAEASAIENEVTFGGRLGTYQYLDMHMAIASALSKYRNEVRGILLARAKPVT
jgi:UDP-galactopyranose mutase